ncbi:hypothetical protein D3C87_2087410 [compost metagenome]
MARAQLPVGPGEHLGIDGVHLAGIVDQPVAALAALLAPPFAIGEAGGVQVQAHGGDVLVGLASVALA